MTLNSQVIVAPRSTSNMTTESIANGYLGPVSITGIVLFGLSIIFAITLLCACFRIRCLLKNEIENEQKEVEVF